MYLLKSAGAEPENEEDVVVWHEGIGDTHDDQSPLGEQKDRLATQMIRQRRKNYRSEYHADDQNCLRQVFEVFAITDEIPLKHEEIN